MTQKLHLCIQKASDVSK